MTTFKPNNRPAVFDLTKRNSERQKMQGRPKPKAWSHQDDLVALIGKEIQVLVTGTMYQGTLLAADQFTLKIQASNRRPVVIYKSSITYFSEV